LTASASLPGLEICKIKGLDKLNLHKLKKLETTLESGKYNVMAWKVSLPVECVSGMHGDRESSF
jgi:hypothetical protein